MQEPTKEPLAPPTRKSCFNCGHEVHNAATFCSNCGASLAAPNSKFKKRARRLSLASIGGSLMIIGAVGACFTVLAGGAWFGLRFLLNYPLPALAVLVLFFWKLGGERRLFRLTRRPK